MEESLDAVKPAEYKDYRDIIKVKREKSEPQTAEYLQSEATDSSAIEKAFNLLFEETIKNS